MRRLLAAPLATAVAQGLPGALLRCAGRPRQARAGGAKLKMGLLVGGSIEHGPQ